MNISSTTAFTIRPKAQVHRWQLRQNTLIYGEFAMAFILGVILFVGVVGFIDAGLPWPHERRSSERAQ